MESRTNSPEDNGMLGRLGTCTSREGILAVRVVINAINVTMSSSNKACPGESVSCA